MRGRDTRSAQPAGYRVAEGGSPRHPCPAAWPHGEGRIARRCLAEVGDHVSVEMPAGTVRYRIVSLTTLPRMLDLEPAFA